jgi:hypothetical protein
MKGSGGSGGVDEMLDLGPEAIARIFMHLVAMSRRQEHIVPQ